MKLGDLCSVVTKGTTPTSVGLDFAQAGIPFLRVQDIGGNTVSLENVLYIDSATHHALERSKVRGGDFLITIAGTVGRTAVVPSGFPESNCNQAVAILRFNNERLCPNYLLHWFSTDDAVAQISGRKVTATISNLSLGQIRELEIPLPALSEQRRIAAMLDKVVAIRQKRDQAIDLADEFLRALFVDMFGDPVTNSKGWELSPFSAVGTLDRGRSRHRPRNDPALLGGAHPLIQTGEVANSRGYIKRYSATYSDFGLSQSKKWEAGTLCITIAANIAKTGILNFPACFPDSVVGFLPNNSVTVEYIQHWLGFLQKNLEENAPQAAQKNINLEILKALPVPLPPKSEQEKFSAIVRRVIAVEETMTIFGNELGNAFDALCQRAFSDQA
ncbi:restriction endonuclease subunit S [Pseudomonas japonica]|uniref:restriction endonuclease subunit S n=1 Tax=Pseudomonas japonica TaxID=256466 RepID=UPI001130F010|nr:restriction endonuclease subunit S [Pseudomonas japonica]